MINHQFTVMAKKIFKDFFVKLLLLFIFHHGWRYYILCWQSDLQTEPFIHLILCFRVNTRESHAHVARLSSFIHIYIHVQIWIKDVQKHRKCCNIRKKRCTLVSLTCQMATSWVRSSSHHIGEPGRLNENVIGSGNIQDIFTLQSSISGLQQLKLICFEVLNHR